MQNGRSSSSLIPECIRLSLNAHIHQLAWTGLVYHPHATWFRVSKDALSSSSTLDPIDGKEVKKSLEMDPEFDEVEVLILAWKHHKTNRGQAIRQWINRTSRRRLNEHQ
jgi:hypothetical protein